MAVDPTYPFYPIACLLSAVMLLLVLLTSLVRQSWNLGVAFLCFWLFLENIAGAVNAIVWADNADIKLYVYCDIVSHLGLLTSIVKPMATLIITRRLYLITSLQSVELPSRAAVQQRALILTQDYIVQQLRFEVDEGFGCGNSTDGSVLDILLTRSWTVIPPLISVAFYYPRVIRIFYRQSRDINHFLQSNNSVSRTNYIRIFVLASIDVVLTLPLGIVATVLSVTDALSDGFGLPFYLGWTYDHTDWEPTSFSYQSVVAEGASSLGGQYFSQWSSPVLAFAIFGLFGVTSEARASYLRTVYTICGWFGWKPTLCIRRARSPLKEIGCATSFVRRT
ncbi:fungal pheromone STE3G-protein-coupled receptor [Peniophora sp. CONT]|nr:fungal pheromone STE3G-protein-coupled receptor [Peniophora sp. CONT]